MLTNKPKFYFFVGAPGIGKTTLVRALLEPGSALNAAPKWTIGKGICAAGHYTGGTFDGADTVPYNGAAAALDWWDAALYDRPVTIFDGDRFSNAKVLAWARARGEALAVCICGTEALLRQRREQRGSKQNEAWMAGRKTKADNFAALFPCDDIFVLMGDSPTAAQVDVIRGWRGWP